MGLFLFIKECPQSDHELTVMFAIQPAREFCYTSAKNMINTVFDLGRLETPIAFDEFVAVSINFGIVNRKNC